MINKHKVLAIIPARKNSKGLKNKNKLKFNKKPLFFWPLNAAIKSKYIDKIVLSSDDNDILRFSKNFNEVLFLKRPKKFAKDNSKSFDVIKHTIQFLNKKNNYFDYIVLIEPTSPLTNNNDIDITLKKLHTKRKIADSIVSISKNEKYHPDFNFFLHKNGLIKSYKNRNYNKRRQELSKLYFIDGSIYISKVDKILKYETFLHKKTIGSVLENYKSIEIDNYIDFFIFENLSKNINKIK